MLWNMAMHLRKKALLQEKRFCSGSSSANPYDSLDTKPGNEGVVYVKGKARLCSPFDAGEVSEPEAFYGMLEIVIANKRILRMVSDPWKASRKAK